MSGDVILDYLLSGILRDKVCKICLSTGEELVPLSEIVEGEITLRDMVLSITSLQVEEDINMPKNVCKTCFEKILNCYSFRIKCEDADYQLKQSIKLFYEEVEKMSCNGNASIMIVKKENDKNMEEEKSKINVEQVFKVELNDSTNETELISINDDSLQIFLDKTLENLVLDSFKCLICLQKFETYEEFNTHQIIHSTNYQNICKICSKAYKSVDSLNRHLVIHDGNEKFVCDHCNKSFYCKNTLQNHIVKYHSETNKKFKCQICSEQYYSKLKILNHLKMEHLLEFVEKGETLIDLVYYFDIDKKVLDCTMCDDSFKMQDDLTKHKSTHSPGTKHMCRVCGKKYRTVGSLQYHMIRHSGIKNHLCTICGKSFYYNNVLKAHMVYHGKKKHRCQHCDKTYHTQYALQEHFRVNHTAERHKFMCEECGHMCTSHNNLEIHRRGHRPKTYCPHCGRGYKNARYFKQHLQEHNQNNKIVNKNKFVCDYCGEGKAFKSLIERHILSKHLLLRKHICEDCGKAFHTKGGLSEHGAVHSKLKLAECHICKRKLVNNQALAIHLRLHTGQKPYFCTYCDEAFISTSRRMSHMKIKHADMLQNKTEQK